MSGAVRIGVLGCAEIARRRMLPAFAAASDVELVAVASRDVDKATRLADQYGCRAVAGYAELLADPSVDAVYVPVPAALHATWVEAALRAGKHVLAEKPLTTDAATTARLVRLARDRRLALMENVFFLWHRQHQVVRDLVDSGEIGELRTLHAAFTVPRRPDGDIRYRPDLGGGALWDTGFYPVRAALHFLGPALRVAGATLRVAPGFQVETGGAALLTTGEVSAQLTFGLDDGYQSTYRLGGSTGSISLDHAFVPPADHEASVLVRGRDGTREVRVPADDQVRNTVAAFARAVRSGERPGESHRHQALLLDDIRAHGTEHVVDRIA